MQETGKVMQTVENHHNPLGVTTPARTATVDRAATVRGLGACGRKSRYQTNTLAIPANVRGNRVQATIGRKISTCLKTVIAAKTSSAKSSTAVLSVLQSCHARSA